MAPTNVKFIGNAIWGVFLALSGSYFLATMFLMGPALFEQVALLPELQIMAFAFQWCFWISVTIFVLIAGLLTVADSAWCSFTKKKPVFFRVNLFG